MANVSAFDNISLGSPRAGTRAFRATDASGFDILAFTDDIGTRVCFGGLEQDFDSDEEAFTWIERARSKDYRLRIDLVDKRPFRWALEQILPDGDVKEVLVGGHEVPAKHKSRHRIVYRQNRGSRGLGA